MEADTPGRTGRATMVHEEHWQADTSREDVEFSVYLPDAEGAVAPHLIVTVTPYDGDIDDFLDRTIRDLTTTLQRPYIVDVRIWDKGLTVDASEPEPSADTVDVTVMGWTIAHTHESAPTGATLRSTEWLFIDQGLAVQVTGTATTAQWPVFFRGLESMVCSVSTTMEGAA